MSTEGNTVLVTGGAGFIGSHLVESLVDKGYFVKVLDILSRGTLEYIQPLIDKEKVELVVMASHGSQGNFRFGSVTEKVLKNSPVPVTTIPIEPDQLSD